MAAQTVSPDLPSKTIAILMFFRAAIRELMNRFRIAPLSANTLLDEGPRHRDMARHPDSRVTLQRFAK